VVKWEKREFDLPGWLRGRAGEPVGIPSTVWQQLQLGIFAWEPPRADKRTRTLQALRGVPVISFSRAHAEVAARLQAELKRDAIGFADFQIAAAAVTDGAELLSFNPEHFLRMRGLRLATP
jgi:predicted nucleic acid-binding protein